MLNRQRQDIKIYVRELTIAESGEYGDQFYRPYVSEFNGGILDSVSERFSKVRRFTPSVLANIAHRFMVPDLETHGIIDIPHGWSERRGRFVLELDIHVGLGSVMKQIVLGYTNSLGFTTKNVDHDMEFYVNNTYMLTQQTMPNGRGGYDEVWVPRGTADVLADRDNGGLRRRSDELFTMRPEDVYSVLDVEQTGRLVPEMSDLRTTLGRNAVKSRTSNRLAPRFMAKVLDSRHKAMENDYGNAVLELNAEAQGYVQEAYASDDVFLRQISNIRGTTKPVDNFSFRDLLDIDPDTERRTNSFLFDANGRETTRFREMSRPLDGQEEHDRIAALIAMAVPALMMETGIHGLDFKAFNNDRSSTLGYRRRSDGPDFFDDQEDDFVVIPENSRSLIKGMDLSMFLQRFSDRLIDELLLPITGGNMFDIAIQGSCRIFGEIDFDLYWDGSKRGRYILPTFCNALGSPVVTTNSKHVSKMARDFSDLFDELLPNSSLGSMGGNGRGSF